MSRAALVHDSDAAKSATRAGTSVRVSHPGDAFEQEADRVADTVAGGGRVAHWSLNALGFDGVARQAAPNPQPASPGEIAGKVAEALLATGPGKKALAAVTAQATTPAGLVVTGATAIGVVTALGVAKKPLPAQLPAIPLDVLHPGLSVKITYQGPVNRPTGASLSLSFSPKSAEKKPAQSATEKQRAENAATSAELEKFRSGLHGPESKGPVKTAENRAFDQWQMNQLMKIGGFAKPTAALPALGTAPEAITPAKKDTAHTAPAHEEKKKEELPVQRKAASAAPTFTGSAEVDSVLRSPGRPLDRSTQRDMESRIGFDFGAVRLHTDARAADSARSLSAHAYTVGSNVVFAPGRYAPQTGEGRRLLAHELTHVVQQTGAPQRAQAAIRPAPQHVQRFWGIDLPDAKNWLMGKLRGLKGYPLFCVVIGQDLITGAQVERNSTTLTQGVLGLFDNGPALFEKLKKAAGALETAFNWLVGKVRGLGLTEEYFSGLLDKALAAVELLHPSDSWDRVKSILAEPLHKLLELAGEIASKVMEFIMEAAFAIFPAGRKIYAILVKAGNVFSAILADPISFAKNLFAAVQLGFKNFGLNILTHLGNGLKTWIFEELNIKGVTKPTEFSFASILNLVLQVLGLTYAQRRPQLVEKLGEPVVYFFETSAKVLDRVRKQGFVAIWDMIKQKAEGLFDSVIDGIKSWVVKQIVTRGLAMVAALATPIGDFVEIVTSIYATLEFIVEKASKLVALVDSVVNSLADIVAGNIGGAAQKVEDTLDRMIPLLLGFLAGQLHLSGIGASIRKIIDDVRKPIDDAIGKVLDVIVKTAMPLWEAGKAAFTAKLTSIKEWWNKPAKFNFGDEEHEMDIEGDGDHPQVYVHSDKKRLSNFLADHGVKGRKASDATGLAKGLKWKAGMPESLAKTEAGYDRYVKLTELMSNLKAKTPLKSQVTDTNPVDPDMGSAQSASAFLSPGDLTKGSGPYKGKGPPAWNDLDVLQPSDKKHYVRGHLISEKLGGHGDWTNMMPLTSTSNGTMERTVEKTLKELTSNKKNPHYYHYVVTATYNKDVKLGAPVTTKKPWEPSKNKKEAQERLARATLAETRLLRLSWTVTNAEPIGKTGNFEDKGTAVDEKGSALESGVQKGYVEATTK